MSAAIVGLGGARRNAGAALCRGGVLVAACERERITRTRGQSMIEDGFPSEAVDAVTAFAKATAVKKCGGDVTYAFAEDGIVVPDGSSHQRYPHHYGHAVCSFLSSPFDEASILVCDRHGVTLWKGRGDRVEETTPRTAPPPFAALYSAIAKDLGLRPQRDEHRLEALARLSAGGAGGDQPADIANERQRGLADQLIDWLSASVPDQSNVCLAGGLFYNTYFNTRIAEHPSLRAVFVPTHPGNTGLAVGCALAASIEHSASVAQNFSSANPRQPLSAFIGPSFGAEDIKSTLDNCKLVYEYANDGQVTEWTVDALRRGHLVGWFHGAMEWGPRALGHRSILASPSSPYVLENLNRFLKRREVVRSYGVSVRQEDAARLFLGPPASPFMQFDYRVRDPELFRHVVPLGSERLRVHTVTEEPGLLRSLLGAFGAATGLPVLVNTSFNGFHEPIVCTPRDAVRVFYGTGLDMLVMGNFVLRK